VVEVTSAKASDCVVAVVTGGRNYANRRHLFAVLDEMNPDVVVHGGARGADSWAGAWAERGERVCVRVPAKWVVHGRSAGPIRNAEMLRFVHNHYGAHGCTIACVARARSSAARREEEMCPCRDAYCRRISAMRNEASLVERLLKTEAEMHKLAERERVRSLRRSRVQL
jgi:hypothetical protein